MPTNLSFVTDDRHRRLLQVVVDESNADPAVIGILLSGSLARGDALPGADIDLLLLVTDETPTSFSHEMREGIMIERHVVTVAAAQRRVAEQPMAVYIYLDGRILADPRGYLANLTATARARLAAYRSSASERHAIAHWLRSAHIKLTTARSAGDDLKAAYIIPTRDLRRATRGG
jgi:predicted nucleotidyltransferase